MSLPVQGSGMSLVHNEQTKLTATALNNVAVAFVIAGFVAPIVGLGQSRPADIVPVLFSLIWLLTGLVLHLAARLILRTLQP
jgi:hypothetical protein